MGNVFIIVELTLTLWQVQVPAVQVSLGFPWHLSVAHGDSDNVCAYKILRKGTSPKRNSHMKTEQNYNQPN